MSSGIRRAFSFLTAALVLIAPGIRAATEPATLFSDAAAIRRLPRTLAGKELPVQLDGVVLWRSRRLGGFVLQSGEEAIYVMCHPDAQEELAARDAERRLVDPGFTVEVRGVTGRGEFAPVVQARTIVRKGAAPHPVPRRTTLAELLTGRFDCQWVEIEGVVQAVQTGGVDKNVMLEIAEETGKFRGVIAGPALLDATPLVDARVRLRGAVFSLFNSHGEIFGISVQTNRADDLSTLIPPPHDPFGGRRATFGELRPFSPDGLSLHRVTVTGVVTAAAPDGGFYLQQGQRAVQVLTAEDEGVEPGAVLEVAAFPRPRGAGICLEGAVFRKTGMANPPEPVAVTVAAAVGRPTGLLSTMSDYDGRLVRLRGNLVSVESGAANARAVLESEGRLVMAEFDPGGARVPARLQPGSVVEVTGVASMSYRDEMPVLDYPRPTGMRLVPRSFDDFTVIKSAPWWTTRRLAWLSGLAAFTALALLTWNWTLRARVARQGHELFFQKRALRDAELERESAQRERDRIAGELHDGVQQWLSTVSLHLNAASSSALTERPEAAAHLLTAQRGLLRTQEELRRSVWGLHQAVSGGTSLREALERSMEVFADWRGAALRVEESGAPLRLPAHVVASLVLVAQEAVGNALRHGEARTVQLGVRWRAEGLELAIVDDGRGFDPDAGEVEGHFGLSGMRARLRRIGGSLRIESGSSAGSTLTASVPREALDAEGAEDLGART